MALLYRAEDKTAILFLFIHPSHFWAGFLRKRGSMLAVSTFPPSPAAGKLPAAFSPVQRGPEGEVSSHLTGTQLAVVGGLSVTPGRAWPT